MTKNIFRLVGIVFLIFLGAWLYHLIGTPFSDKSKLEPDSEIIQQQLKNVSKLVVNEAKLAQVYNYKDSKSYMMNFFSFDKKAVVLINADVLVMYDLSKLEYEIDEANKIVRITYIPKEEVKITPDIKIYDVEESRFNSFTGEDYNKISEKIKEEFKTKVLSSNIQSNAQNRLISELSKFLVVTKSLGWQLQYQDQVIEKQEDLSIPIKG